MKALTPLIIAEEPLLRLGLRHFLTEIAGVKHCVEAATAVAALKQQAEHHPELILLCSSGKSADTVRLIRDLRRRVRGQALLVISRTAAGEHVQECLDAGALGYVLSHDEISELQLAFAAVLKKDLHVSRNAAKHLHLGQGTRSKADAKAAVPQSLLSTREKEVFQLIGNGCGCKEIATELGISIKTVESHQDRMKDKLNLCNCSELRRLAKSTATLTA
jgi:DNA-binding NarL/FixJ family response regulator